MVKGISRQVIVVQSPDPNLFDQAIFILKDKAVCKGGITDEALLKEAKMLMRGSGTPKRKLSLYGPAWACAGALITGMVWLITVWF